MKIVGIILIVLGILGFVFRGIPFTKTEEVLDLGSVEVEKTEERLIPIPYIVSGIVVIAGVALVVTASRKKT